MCAISCALFLNRFLRCRALGTETSQVALLVDVSRVDVEALLARYHLQLVVQPDGEPITGSYWGDSEAGIVGHSVYARNDTPVHSLLHEACHIVCMAADRRRELHKDAGGDDLEEAAVCYLQVLLADELDGLGRDRLMADMDVWGYSFRLGSTATWFAEDAEDALNWLINNGIVGPDESPTFALRR